MKETSNSLPTHPMTKNINQEVIDKIIPDTLNLQIYDNNNLSSKCSIHEVIKTTDGAKKYINIPPK